MLVTKKLFLVPLFSLFLYTQNCHQHNWLTLVFNLFIITSVILILIVIMVVIVFVNVSVIDILLIDILFAVFDTIAADDLDVIRKFNSVQVVVRKMFVYYFQLISLIY